MNHQAMLAKAMPRRQCLLCASAGLASWAWLAPLPAAAQGLPWAPAYTLALDGRAQWLREFSPAGSPLRQLSARPGAWYALLYLPVAELWPVQLVFAALPKRHELRTFALNAPPEAGPTVVHALPLELESPRAYPAAQSSAQAVSRFMLPAASGLDAVFVLTELWSIKGDAPPPLRAQLQSYRPPQRATAPWWDAHSAKAAGHNALQAPPSPLATQSPSLTRLPYVHELPFALPALQPAPQPMPQPVLEPSPGLLR